MALKYHPDKNAGAADPEAIQQKFMEAKAAYDLLLEGMRTGKGVSAADSAAFGASKTGGGGGGKRAVDLAVAAALSVRPSTGDSLSSRAADLAKQRAESANSKTDADEAAAGPKKYSETEG